MTEGKHAATHTRRSRRRRWPWVVVATILVFAMALGGTGYAAYRYDQTKLDEILPGVRVAGIDVSGMTRDEALAALKAKYDEDFSKEINVQAGGRKWTITPADMRARAPYEAAVEDALALTGDYEWTERFWRRWNTTPEGATFDVPVTMDPEEVKAFVAKVGGAVGETPVDGGLRLSGQNVQFVQSQPGRELNTPKSLAKVRVALRESTALVKLPVAKVQPKVTGTETKTIVIDLSENRLYLYKGKKIDRKYNVATGAPGFPTPDGSFSIIEMRKNPTWTNPDPNGWGSSMPASIPPGPGNPLGTRAMNLNAPGIRIHGTSDIGSLGTAASHGCIRMAMPDVEQLFKDVGVGTAVLIKK